MAKKSAIITGVSSFVGCHLARIFADAGYDVIAVTSRASTAYDGVRAARLASIEGFVQFAVCDLTDADQVGALIKTNQPDVWVQHAGYADNYASPAYDLEKSLTLNVVALEPLYRALKGTGCGVIVTGSSMEYASSDVANREDDACWPELPYGVSKLAETVEASRLARQYGVPTRVARLYIPVGTFDAPGKLMDYVIEQLAAGHAAELSPCTQKRDFLGVDDLCQAYVRLAQDFERQVFDVFNICSGDAMELKSLLTDVARTMGVDEAWLKFDAKPMRPGEALVSYGDNTKAKALLGWHPRPIQETLKVLIHAR